MDLLEKLKVYVNSDEFKKALNIDGEVNLSMVAMGEYNINYLFTHPNTEEKLILRVNTKSQMNLENQIEYEYKALKGLYLSGRVPKVYYVDSSYEKIEYGLLVMEFLNGEMLDYEKDLKLGLKCLSDIHSTDIKNLTHLISPKNPLKAMYEECSNMASVYLNSSLGDKKVSLKLRRLLEKSYNLIKNEKDYTGKRYPINTELNSGNFLINRNEKNYIIDWEKPILGEVSQDIAHFLAPITTFWKTDIILSKNTVKNCIDDYIKYVDNRFDTSDLKERFEKYMPLTCLRGVTWCAMAFIEYQDPNRLIKNEFTYNKIKSYLSYEFLDKIEKEYF